MKRCRRATAFSRSPVGLDFTQRFGRFAMVQMALTEEGARRWGRAVF
jgi:hypothetical protein